MKKLNAKKGSLARHGDVGLIVCKPPARKGRKVKPDGVVAEGEVTGHAHRLSGDAKLYEQDGELYIRVGDGPASIKHEEHAEISLPRNKTLMYIQQREWTPVGDRAVVD